MKPGSKYYLQATIRANYSGFNRDDKSTKRQSQFQLKDLLNTEISNIQRIDGYDSKYLTVGDNYLFFPDLYGVLLKHGGTYYRINLSNSYLTDIRLSEHGKDGIYSFGKLEGIVNATIENPIQETVLPKVLSYSDSSEEKQITVTNNTSGDLTPVDIDTAKPIKTTDQKNKYINGGSIFGCLTLLVLGIILLGAYWKSIGIFLLLLGGILFLGWLFGSIRQWIGYIVAALVIIGILSWFFSTTSKTKSSLTERGKDDARETSTIRKDTTQKDKSDSILIVHHRNWNDYAGHAYETDLIIRQNDYLNSKRFHFGLSDGYTGSEHEFWRNIYNQLSNTDKGGLQFIYEKLDSIARNDNMDQVQFANMVVSCVQDIPYVLISNLDCDRYKIENPQDVSVINQTGCFGPSKFGVQSPTEFMYNLKGDCDTRTLFCFTVLSRFNYDVAILNSNQYRHSILGINIPVEGEYKMYRGNRYYLWETTAKGCIPGFISPDYRNMSYWDFILLSK
ncbi:MAG: hypothetical protein E6H07_07765 [Bacteroidetes bacterium]|nr:MAG: hypothetical protein E6H07_07765 [Bacteroidota bacterium]